MADDHQNTAGDPDRSSLEVKALLRKLDPKSGTHHKDRVRQLARFRNYVTGGGKGGNITTPEFYDDDYTLLLLGSQSPSTVLTSYDEEITTLGLLHACGAPSTDHAAMLKRSARNAMNLLKFLTVDFVEMKDGVPMVLNADAAATTTGKTELNGFAQALCMCTPSQLRVMNLELHLRDEDNNKRGGAKEDACEIIVLLLTRHLDENGEVFKPLGLEELLPTSSARRTFDSWLSQNKNRDVQHAVKKATIERDGERNKKQQQQSGAAAGSKKPGEEEEEERDENTDDLLDMFKRKQKTPKTKEEAEAEAIAAEHAEEQLDEMGLNLYSRDAIIGPARSGDIHGDGTSGPPTKWADSKLSGKDGTSGLFASDVRARDAEREAAERAAEKARLEEERLKVTGRDPLGIRADDFDLRQVQNNRVELLMQALHDIEDEMEEEERQGGGGGVGMNKGRKRDGLADHLISLSAQKETLLAILEGPTGVGGGVGVGGDSSRNEDDAKEDGGESKDAGSHHGVEERSILPTDPNFDPLLFLTLVHRNASFEQLMDSIGKLSNKTDSQVVRLQNLVRDNFELFVRCADGIDLFADPTASGKRGKNKSVVKERLDKLDALSESCSYQAKKSFKPLLDNTNEVRKVQSALAVLQRVSPLLKVPTLMRQHLENGRFSAAIKAYRRVLVIEDGCNIELLRNVKLKAAEAAREAQRDLESTLGNPNAPITNLLDAIRDLGELIELDVPHEPKEEGKSGEMKDPRTPKASSVPADTSFFGTDSSLFGKPGVITVGGAIINVRDHPPPLACLLLQSAHFSSLVEQSVFNAEESTRRIFEGEASLSQNDEGVADLVKSDDHGSQDGTDTKSGRAPGNRWKYDVLEARVGANVRAVSIARNWLPRLLRIGAAARDSERRRAARIGRRYQPSVGGEKDNLEGSLTAFEVFVTNISPAVSRLVEHATFCALGCSNDNTGEGLKMTFGQHAHENLQALLRAPLPPTQSAKCAKELADLVEVVCACADAASSLRPQETDIDAIGGKGGLHSPAGSFAGEPTSSHYQRLSLESPLAECTALAEEAVITVERRKCIYAFDICARNCSLRASGNGIFDGDALLLCVQKLSDELTRPEECANEVQKGCELVVRRCCEGLASYVRDRGDAARLRAVAECAEALNGRIVDLVREVSYLTSGQCETLEEALAEDIMALEGAMFDEFLENVRRNVGGCARLGWVDVSIDDKKGAASDAPTQFPAYLSASLLAIVRCRAQVEKALGDTTIRRSDGVTYQFLAMATAADGVIEGICGEMNQRSQKMRGRQADRMSNELQFLINTLKSYLSDEMLAVADNCRRMLCSKAGRGGGIQGDGPDGLAAIEELERLGRVYVMCLGD